MSRDENEEKPTPDETTADDNSSEDTERIDDDVQAYVEALNRFTSLIGALNWPDHLPIDSDTDLCIRVFRNFWQYRLRQQREHHRDRRVQMRFGPFDEGQFKQFLKEKFSARFQGEDEPLFIDPEEHQPDEDHLHDDAKARQRRFQDEWE